MKTIDPRAKAQTQGKLLMEADLRRSSLRKLGKEKAKIYMQSEHRFMLLNGDVRTEIIRAMTGREAKKLNSLNVIKFGAGKTKCLMRWWCQDNAEAREK